jgi:formylglycine-generating enzyme required for sulfatase activity
MALVSGGHLPPIDRAIAGRALGWLGDERPGVGVKNGVPDIDWIEIEAGSFIMGGQGYWEGKSQFNCNLIQQPYRISRYPVTVAQFKAFIDDRGYSKQYLWTTAGWDWLRINNINSPQELDNISSSIPNHPQTGISWFEATAFCTWLSGKLHQNIRLPTEAEWERAARHTDGRTYPWGNRFNAKYCNMNDTGIGTTSAVGIFPNALAKCGADDMAGNILEWCSTKWIKDYLNYEARVDNDLQGSKQRVLRGGSFYSFRFRIYCTYRQSYYPDHRTNIMGFRLVCIA